jgi:hypothetical protein
VEASQPNAVPAGNRDARRLAGRGLAVDSETNLQFEVLFCSQNIFGSANSLVLFCEFEKEHFFGSANYFWWF